MTKDERDLIRDLEHAEPPQIELHGARVRLRRALLASPDFAARASTRRTSRWRLAFAGLAAAAVVAILAIQLIPRRSSAEALLAAMGSAYDASVVPDAIHYLRQSLRLNSDPPLELESWLYADQRKFRVRVKDAGSSKTLAHTISNDGRIFNLPESSLHVVGETHRRSSVSTADAGHADTNPTPGDRMMTIVITRVHQGDDWSDDTPVRAFLISDFFSRAPSLNRTPQDLVHELEGSDQVMYAGATLDSRNQRQVELLERPNAGALPFVVEFPMKRLEDVQGFLARVLTRTSRDGSIDAYEALLEEQGLGGVVTLRPVAPVERVEIDSETSRIRKLSLSIFEHGDEIYSAETTFLEDRYLPYAPDTFDPDLHGLSLESQSTRSIHQR